MGDYVETSYPTKVKYLLKKTNSIDKRIWFLDPKRSTKRNGYSINP